MSLASTVIDAAERTLLPSFISSIRFVTVGGGSPAILLRRSRLTIR
jgi:hypothetical protein